MTSTAHLRRHRAAGSDVVREARPVLDRHAPVRALRSTLPSRPPWEARTDFDALRRPRRSSSPALAADAPRHPPRCGRRAPAARHARTSWPSPAAGASTGRPANATRCRARRCRGWSSWSGTTPHRRRRWPSARPAGRRARRRPSRASRMPVGDRSTTSRRATARSAAAWPTGGPSLDRDAPVCEAILAAVRHHQRPSGRRRASRS